MLSKVGTARAVPAQEGDANGSDDAMHAAHDVAAKHHLIPLPLTRKARIPFPIAWIQT
jgi:hypothetical protein